MNIILNNNPEEFPGNSISIARIMELKRFTFKMLVVKLNDKVVPKENYASTLVVDGDNLVILHLISGG